MQYRLTITKIATVDTGFSRSINHCDHETDQILMVDVNETELQAIKKAVIEVIK